MEDTISATAPMARVRVSNKFTNQKWTHETTVELTFAYESGRQHAGILAGLLQDADIQGREESARRTERDAAEAQEA